MKISELIRELQILKVHDPNFEVFLSKDPEGNLFRAVEYVDIEYFDYTNDLAHKEDPGSRRVVVIWP